MPAEEQQEQHAEDYARIATAAYLTGDDAASHEAWARAHQLYLEHGDVPAAVRCAYWLGMQLQTRGEHARSNGWLERARRLLAGVPHRCVEEGYLHFPAALKSAMSGDFETAYAGFTRVVEIGESFGDADLAVLARQAQGRALIHLGRIEEGVALLDEAMATVEAGQIAPMIAGTVYCSVIEACYETLDIRRAQEWTNALSRWCEAQPDLVPFRGQCLVRRSELMRLHGAWDRAMSEAVRACERLSEPPPPHPAIGGAFYQRAELHRLRGEFAEADAAYRAAARWLRVPRPGLALLRLAQGDIEAARSTIAGLLETAHERATRAPLLAAAVEIAIAADDRVAARRAADELGTYAEQISAPLLHALATQALGAVQLHEGDARAALESLHAAHAAWLDLDAPYEAARTRALIARAARMLGDEETARIEMESARATFRELDAAEAHDAEETGLTPRELEVLRHVAAGSSNRVIAAALFISEKTVARHLANIFAKLGLASRAAAAAYAYKHGLA